MAIEINEMVVKASTGKEDSSGADSIREETRGSARDPSGDLEKLKKQLLSECREMILEILEEQMER